MGLHELRHALDRTGLDLALDLGDRDPLLHLALVGAGQGERVPGRGIHRQHHLLSICRRDQPGHAGPRPGRTVEQGPDHEEDGQQGDDQQDHPLDDLHDVVLVEAHQGVGGHDPAAGVGAGELDVDHRNLIASLGVEADSRPNQLLDPLHFRGGTGRVGAGLAVLAGRGRHAIHSHGDGEALDLSGLLDLGAHGLGDVVVRRRAGPP